MSAVPNPVPFPVLSFPPLGLVVIPLPLSLPSLFLFVSYHSFLFFSCILFLIFFVCLLLLVVSLTPISPRSILDFADSLKHCMLHLDLDMQL